MLPIAFLISQTQMRRSLTGARATDVVVADRPRRPRRRSRVYTPRVVRAGREHGAPSQQAADRAAAACAG